MVSQTIVVREPKATMPDDFKLKLLETHPTAFGVAIPQDEDRVDWKIFDASEDDLFDSLRMVEETYADDRVFYYFVNGEEGGINFESLQPVALLTEKQGEGEEDKVILSVMAVGELPEYQNLNEDGEEFSEQFFFIEQFVKPLISELWDMASDDIKVLLSFLEKKVQHDKVKTKLGANATVLFIPKILGKAIAYSNPDNKNSGSWSWGWASNSLGFSSDTSAAAPVLPKKTLGLKKPAADTGHPPGGTPISAEEKKYAPLLADKDRRFFLKEGKLHVKPPAAQAYKETRTWYNTHYNGAIPKDAKVMYAGFPFENLRSTSPIRAYVEKLLGEAKPEKPKEAEHEPGPAEPPKEVKPPTHAITLHIPKDQKEKFAKAMKEGRFKATDLEALKQTLADFPAASLQLGETWETFRMMDPLSLLRLTHDVGAHTALCLLHEARCRELGLYGEKKTEEAAAPSALPKKILGLKKA